MRKGAVSTCQDNGGAGIGGGGGGASGGTGSNIQIHGGTVNATGGDKGAGIGGGSGGSKNTAGAGTNITVSGGKVTAVGGQYAAGIGGGGGYYYSTQYGSGCLTGGTGSVTITGGIVDASSLTDVYYADYKGAPIGNGGNTTVTATVSKTTGIVFENGAGTVCGDVTFDGSYTLPADYTLNIPAGASLSGSGTLSGGSAFTTENLTADMISVPTNLYYSGEDRTEYLTNELSTPLNEGITLCGKTFTVSGWTLAVEKTDDLRYTATYTNNNDNNENTFTKTITLLQSGTKFTGGIKTFNGETETTSFTAGDTITVKATPTATGAAPVTSAMFTASLAAPTAGQMAVFVNDTQVSGPVDAGADGTYTMTVSASDVLFAAGGPGNVKLTARFVESASMADAAEMVDVTISAAAKVEKDGATSYVDKNGLINAFAYNSGYEGATITLLDNMTITEAANRPKINICCILNLNGHTICSDITGALPLEVSGYGNVTITGNGEIVSNSGAALYVMGTAVLEGGIFRSGGAHCGAVEVMSGNLSVTGENVVMENTGSKGYGLDVSWGTHVQLSAGTYSGAARAISVSNDCTLAGLLKQEDASRVAYYKDNAALVTEGLDGQILPSGSYTVRACTHTGEGVCTYAHNENTSTHTKTCLACGETWNPENCTYTFSGATGTCAACGDSVAVAVSGTENLVYDGTWKEPGVTVTRGETPLAAGADYTVAYSDNKNAGENKAAVTVTIGNGQGAYTENFSIGKATPTVEWKPCDVELTYTGQPAAVKPVVTLVNGEEYTGDIHYQYDSSDSLVLPADAGSYGVTASIPEQDNYTDADTEMPLILYIHPADQAAPAAPTATEDNIKDNSITLDTIENAEYSKDGTNWQASPTFTGLDPNHEYTFYARLKGDKNHNVSGKSAGTEITTRKMLLENAVVTVSGTYTYDGQEKEPEITVMLNGAEILSSEYDIACHNSAGGEGDRKSAGTVTVTVTAKDSSDYEGTATGTFRIAPAPLTVREATAQNRPYDGTNRVTVTGVTLGGIMEGDTDTVAVDVSGIQGILSGANAGTYTAVTLPELTLTGEDSGNYTLVQPQTAVPASVKITPLDAVITVGTDAYSKTFGDAAFTLDATDDNPEAVVRYEVTEGADVVSVENGTVTILNAGTATITVSLPESANYNAAASKTITVNVAQKGRYTVTEQNRSYLYSRENTGSIDLTALLPKDCGAVTYGTPAVSGDVTYSAAPAVDNGILSYTLNSGSKNAEGTITVTVSTRNYTDITVTVKVKLTDQMPVSLKTGTEVTLENNVLTYGEPLSKLKFNKAEFVDDDGKTVEGILAWKDAAATPNVGTTGATWVFTPNDEAYAPVEGTAAVTVNKAVPAVSAAPTVEDRVYGPSAALQDSDLKGGTVNVPGTWSWQNADIVPTVNNSGYAAVFTPKDATNYETVTRTITVNVTKATPYIAGLPAAAAITYGEALKDSLLSGGSVQYGNGAGQAGDGVGSAVAVTGTFTWKEPSAKPVVADSNVTEYTVVFAPSDTANYNPVEAKATLTVNKAQNAPNMPGSAMSVSNSIEKVGSVPLPAGWEWQASDEDTALEVGVAVSTVAVYTGADKGNYENEMVTVAITRSNCDHVAGDVLYTGEGEKAPTCTEDGLGHKECTVCGAVMESGIVVEALKHTGGTATCSKRQSVCTRCGQPYGDTDGSVHGDTEVRGFVAAACTAGGYTGDTYCKDCGAKTKTGNATSALGHNYTSTVTKEPTTGSGGTRTYTCTRCGHSYTEGIPKLPEETHHHSYSGSVTKQPTCTDTGIRTYTCSCGDSYTETIAALGHHYQSSVTRQPTTMSEGVMTYTCDRCGHSYTRPIAKLPGDDTTKPGSGQPGDTEPGSGSTEGTRPDTGIPFIKDEDGKTGWDVIRAEEEQAQEGSAINVDMNGTTVVPGDIFDIIKGKDITVTFDMGNGILWSVEGKDITTGKAGDIDFSVKTGTNAIPADIINNVTGQRYSIQISLAHEGEFGFTAVLSIGLGRENAGYTAGLYYYNGSTGELEFICADTVAEDGTVSLAFTYASDYVIAIDREEESGNAAEPAQPDTPDKDSAGKAESPQTGQPWRPWWLIAAGALVVIVGIGVFFIMRRKNKGSRR